MNLLKKIYDLITSWLFTDVTKGLFLFGLINSIINYITQQIYSPKRPSIAAIAKQCGTSSTMIEAVYYQEIQEEQSELFA